MLDTDTKRRIDTCRDILVGKVPDPKSQVEQITIALIYKFMDDMDAEAEELGGNRTFFSGEYDKFGWSKLMAPNMGGYDVLALYSEAIQKMNENPGIPALFRDIFKNAYLPYRDPETLRSFLKEIDGFTYDHSERLGDAFEYLLSVLGSQGDAGQFRTPRHIIDFMVEITDPKKGESILDPACGTAGFLISAWKHILKSNTKTRSGDLLTPDERKYMAANIFGYDISPDMVRLSLVNMYLHGFTDPHIVEYDTLTSEEKWNEYADVILANPPFMSPKGGIKPHKRFSVQATRSEVLFVDYMAEHLTPNGRAAIIVPEGIIFQSQTAYKQLRKMLVENYLVAVVSLPAGVFQPYSGVKTSILILDKSIAKRSDRIGFFKVENDGFNLGAQRRAIEKNDLPDVAASLKQWLDSVRSGDSTTLEESNICQIVEKAKISANGEYNLSGERYKENGYVHKSEYPLKKLGELCTIRTGKKDVNSGNENGKYPFFTCAKNHTYSNEYSFDTEAILIAGNGDVGAVQYFYGKFEAYQRTYVLSDWTGIESRYLYFQLRDRLKNTVSNQKLGNTMPYIKLGMLTDFQIPLPPLEVQQEIVAEIEGYQKIIDGARAVIDNYRPHIPIDPEWPMVELGEIVDELESGVSVNSTNSATNEGQIGILKTSCVTSGIFQPQEHKAVVQDELSRVRCPVRRNTIIISRMNTEALVGANAYVDGDYPHLFLPDRLWQTVISREDVEVRYLQTVLASDVFRRKISAKCGGTSGSMKNISKPQLLSLQIPFPPLATQQAIVAEIEAEQALVSANRELITRFEKKIQSALARVWGEEA